MLHREQRGLYVQGMHISKEHVLKELAKEIGLDEKQFTTAYKQLEGSETQDHINQNRALLVKVGGRGFPTFVVETVDDDWAVIDQGAFLGKPEAWEKHLQTLLKELGHDIVPLDEKDSHPAMCAWMAVRRKIFKNKPSPVCL